MTNSNAAAAQQVQAGKADLALPMFYIRDSEGDQDLMVRANDADDALGLWRAHYDRDDGDTPDYIGQVPLTNQRGAIKWEDITKNAVQFS